MVFPSEDRPTHSSLDGVVVEWDASVLDETSQPRPKAEHVLDGFAQPALRQYLRSLLESPFSNSLEGIPRALLPELQS